jgi:hypothetical protein
MAQQHQDEDRNHTGWWLLATLGAALGAAGGWLWARTHRDRLVAEVGTAVHEDDVHDGPVSGSAVAEPGAGVASEDTRDQ